MDGSLFGKTTVRGRHSGRFEVKTDLHTSILHFLADELVTITALNPPHLPPNQSIDAVIPDILATLI